MPKPTFTTESHSANPNLDYTGYIVSRKLNGRKIVWDGGVTRGMPAIGVPWYKHGGDRPGVIATGLWSRKGKVVRAPKWWLDCLPKYIPLEGELWHNDSKLYASVAASHDTIDPRWDVIKFIVYNYKPYSLWDMHFLREETHKLIRDSQFYANSPYSIRLMRLDNAFNYLSEPFYTVGDIFDYEKLREGVDLKQLLQQRTAGAHSWEGLMLANPNGMYTPFRSDSILKLKPEYDLEVTVVGHTRSQSTTYFNKLQSLCVRTVWDEKVTSFHGGKPEYIGRTVFFHVGSGFSKSQREWDYVRENFPVGGEIRIKFNEIGEQGAPPSASLHNDFNVED